MHGVDPFELSDVIGLIYDAASDASAWPQLLERLGLFMLRAAESQGDEGGRERVMRDIEACLMPHVTRAQDLHIELTDLGVQRDGLEAAISHVPLGMAVVRSDGTLVSLNQAMMSIANAHGGVSIESGVLVSTPRQALQGLLRDVTSGGVGEAHMHLPAGGGETASTWVRDLGRRPGMATNLALVLVASSRSRALSVDALMQMYRLTQAEARLTQQLVLGQTLEEASAALQVSMNTVKTQLKRVFEKVGVRRQTELLQSVYASPLWLLRDKEPVPADTAGLTVLLERRRKQACNEGVLKLPDGRRLAYTDQGSPDGVPLLFMHGLAGSRYLRHPDDTLLMEAGVRLIIPERPGCGDSDPMPNRTLDDWVSDIRALASALGLKRFAVMGYSAGAPYALAVGRGLARHVDAVHLVAPVSPVTALADLRHYPAASRLNIMMARHAPGIMRPLLKMAVRDMRDNVFRYVESSIAKSTHSDRAVYANPSLRTAHALGVLAGIQRGSSELYDDVRITCSDWGEGLDDYPLPVQIWHGDSDPLVSPTGAIELARQLPAAQLEMVPGAGHFILYSHWAEILRGVRERVQLPLAESE